jgi:hypothetical protein
MEHDELRCSDFSIDHGRLKPEQCIIKKSYASVLRLHFSVVEVIIHLNTTYSHFVIFALKLSMNLIQLHHFKIVIA